MNNNEEIMKKEVKIMGNYLERKVAKGRRKNDGELFREEGGER